MNAQVVPQNSQPRRGFRMVGSRFGRQAVPLLCDPKKIQFRNSGHARLELRNIGTDSNRSCLTALVSLAAMYRPA